jgi:hypothetical protein
MATTVLTTKVLDGYPQSVGAKTESIAFLTLTGTYSVARIPISAVSYGMKYMEFVSAEGDLTGTYGFVYIPTDETKGVLQAYVLSTGVEVGVVNLTGIVLLVHAHGF